MDLLSEYLTKQLTGVTLDVKPFEAVWLTFNPVFTSLVTFTKLTV